MSHPIRLLVTLTAATLLTACYTSETAVLTADNAMPINHMSEGLYCHAENRLVPPQVTVAPLISEALGENKCRDLFWDAEAGRYVDRLSGSMVFRTRPTQLPELSVLQVQTGEGALARYMPIAAVDGLFVLYDPAGRWPDDLVDASGLTLTEDGTLAAAEPETVSALLENVWNDVLADFRADIAYVDDAAGPRLEFRSVALAERYLVYFHEDMAGDAGRMRAAMLALAESLDLGMHDAVWTEDAE